MYLPKKKFQWLHKVNKLCILFSTLYMTGKLWIASFLRYKNNTIIHCLSLKNFFFFIFTLHKYCNSFCHHFVPRSWSVWHPSGNFFCMVNYWLKYICDNKQKNSFTSSAVEAFFFKSNVLEHCWQKFVFVWFVYYRLMHYRHQFWTTIFTTIF